MVKLGINVDHVATLREARKEDFPSPYEAALAAIKGGADGITAHLREDRRHIQQKDMELLKNEISVPLNMEMAASPEIVSFAETLKPHWVCLVPEKREELTTEGGLNLDANLGRIGEVIKKLHSVGTQVSLFLEPELKWIPKAEEIGADAVEIHTGAYARLFHCRTKEPSQGHRGETNDGGAILSPFDNEMDRILVFARKAKKSGLIVNAGHGLDYENIGLIVEQFVFNEFNIGFSVVARAIFVGMESAVRQMKEASKGILCVES